MIKPFLAGAALCGVLPAFAAANLVADGSFESAGVSDKHETMFTGGASNWLTMDFGTGPITLKPSADVASDNLWQLYTAVFTGAGSSMSLMFGAAGPGDSYGASLDDVSVLPVPEPATLAMVGAGLLGLIGVGWRRARR